MQTLITRSLLATVFLTAAVATAQQAEPQEQRRPLGQQQPGRAMMPPPGQQQFGGAQRVEPQRQEPFRQAPQTPIQQRPNFQQPAPQFPQQQNRFNNEQPNRFAGQQQPAPILPYRNVRPDYRQGQGQDWGRGQDERFINRGQVQQDPRFNGRGAFFGRGYDNRRFIPGRVYQNGPVIQYGAPYGGQFYLNGGGNYGQAPYPDDALPPPALPPQQVAPPFQPQINYFCVVAPEDCAAPLLPLAPGLDPRPFGPPPGMQPGLCDIEPLSPAGPNDPGAATLVLSGQGVLYQGYLPNVRTMFQYYASQGICVFDY